MGPSPVQSADAFQNIMNGILQGQAIRQHIRQAQLEEQAFKTKQALDNQNASVEDIMNRMSLNQAAQPVNSDNTVNEPTTTSSTPSGITGVGDVQTSVPGGRVPLSPDRQVVNYQGVGGQQQYALNSPERNAQLADTAAQRKAQQDATIEAAKTKAQQDAMHQSLLDANQKQLQYENGGTPSPKELEEIGIPQGTALTRAQLGAGMENLSKFQQSQATTRKTAADAAKQEQENQFLQNLKPQDIHSTVDQTIPKDTLDHAALNQRTHQLVNASILVGDKKGALQAVKDASDQLGRTETAVATAKATVPTKIEVGTGIANNQADIQKAEKARGLYVASAQTVNGAEAAAHDVLRVLDLADQGNVAAAGQLKAMLPELTNSVQGIKRMGAGQGNENLGSLGDKLLGFVQNITEGQPIDANVRKQIRQLVPVLASGAVEAHNMNTRSINSTYQTTYPEMQAAPATGNGSTGSGTVRVMAPDGKTTGTIPAERLQQALKQGYKQIQ